jgi:enoyl-CoA hydratase
LSSRLLLSSPEGGVRLFELNRAERLNALDSELVEELHAALDDASLDRDCRVIILTGKGRAFSAGLDLAGFGSSPGADESDPLQWMFTGQKRLSGLVTHLRQTGPPVIAAVNGPAMGAGLGLVLGSDVRLACPSSRFGTAFIKLGVSGCDIGVSWLLPRLVGAARAQELMLSGREFDGEEAARMGMVADLLPDEELLDGALRIARVIAGYPAFAVAQTKEAMWAALEASTLQLGIDIENRQQMMLASSGGLADASRVFRAR